MILNLDQEYQYSFQCYNCKVNKLPTGVKIIAQSGSIVVPGKIGGLCGNFNGRNTDEFTKNTWPAGNPKSIIWDNCIRQKWL